MTKYWLCTVLLASIAVYPSISQGEDLPQCPSDGSEEVYFPNESDCSTFYQCSNGIPILQYCPPGLEFNANLDVCVQPGESNCNTANPTDAPTVKPTDAPTDAPTEAPTDEPTDAPTDVPTNAPTDAPTNTPTEEPTVAPTEEPTSASTERPTERPTTHHPHFPHFPHFPHSPHLPQTPHLPHLPQPPHFPHLPQPPRFPPNFSGHNDHRQNSWLGQQQQGRPHLGNQNNQLHQGWFRPGQRF